MHLVQAIHPPINKKFAKSIAKTTKTKGSTIKPKKKLIKPAQIFMGKILFFHAFLSKKQL